MKKKLSLLLALVMLGTLGFSLAGPASAAGYMSLAVGNTDTITHTGYSIYNATSGNPSVIRIDSITGGIAYVTALTTGTSTVTYYYYNSSGTSTTETVTYTVTGSTNNVYLANVGDTDSSKEIYGGVNNLKSANNSVCRASFVDNRVKITATGVGTTTVTYSGFYNETWINYSIVVTVGGTSGSTGSPISLTLGGSAYTTASFYEVTSHSSSSPSVATVTVDYLNRVVVTPVSVGTSDITYTYRTTYNGTLQTITQRATVSSSGSTSTTESISLLVGNTNNSMRYRIISAVSSNTSVATATVSGSTGSQQLSIKGVGNGTATVTVKYNDNALDSIERTISYYVTVSGGSSSSTTTNSESSGIYFSKTSYTVNKYNGSGKIAGYTIRPLVDGMRVDADTMLWLSTNTSIVTVGTRTGVIRGVKSGTARIICVDADGKYVNSFNVTIKA